MPYIIVFEWPGETLSVSRAPAYSRLACVLVCVRMIFFYMVLYNKENDEGYPQRIFVIVVAHLCLALVDGTKRAHSLTKRNLIIFYLFYLVWYPLYSSFLHLFVGEKEKRNENNTPAPIHIPEGSIMHFKEII